MITIGQDQLITLRDAAKQIPGKSLHYETVRRWATIGIRGQRLETVRIGGRVCTTMNAIRDFVTLLSAPAAVAIPVTHNEQQLRAKASMALLEAELGIR